MRNNVKIKLKKGLPVIGTWMQIPSGDIAEIISRAKFDFCIADLEHSEITQKDCMDIFARLKSSCIGGARVSTNDLIEIRKPLDFGAEIIIIPMVNNREEAEKAVRSAKYPPEGVRGYAFCRTNNWGADFDEYIKLANDDIMVFTMVESVDAVKNIDEILSVNGVDGVLIGPYDLSGSFGLVGQTGCKQVTEAIDYVVEACKRHGKIAGQHIVNPDKEKIAAAIEKGYRFLPVGIDAIYLYNSMAEIVKNFDKEL